MLTRVDGFVDSLEAPNTKADVGAAGVLAAPLWGAPNVREGVPEVCGAVGARFIVDPLLGAPNVKEGVSDACDTAGAGRFRGGAGCDYEVEIFTPADYAFRGEGVGAPSSFGVEGGQVIEGAAKK